LAMDHYRPRRRWFRRLRVDSRLRLHQRSGLLSGADAQALDRLARSPSIKWHFAHGDITARNVLRDRDGHSVLIDWEWAGLYPAGYELAFLWSSLVNIPSGRAHLNAAIPARHEAGFLLSATMVHLLHLQMWRARPHPLAASFEQTLAELLSAVRGRRMGR
jgi:Ser/Thr protein kinase RdoA (MazF antagonist)